MRSSSLANNPLAITRELDGRYDVVLQVRDNLDLIEQVVGVDFAAILAELESAQDFTGITVVQGEIVAWDAVNKILTVPKGDKGDKGDVGDTGLTGPQGIQGPKGIKGDTGLKGDTGSQGPKGFDGATGAQGPKGDTGNDLTVSQITYNGSGTFNWLFSDGTVYVTPSLKGPKGDVGDQGVKGDQGISVHHIKGTSTTDLEGDFGASGEIDTYTVYGDANETINLGFFIVRNGYDAYNYAVTAGYAGTEADFYLELATVKTYSEQSQLNANAAALSASQVVITAGQATTAASASSSSASAASASAAAALVSETNANTSKNTAATSATTATTKAAAADVSATNAASSATSASTSATSASNSATASTAKASEASTSASNAALSATNSANSATSANASATASSTSATNSANSATDAAASATSASASAATASAKASEALASAANAATSETNAGNSEDIAIAKASEASTSANNAATSEVNALVSKNSASTSASTATAQATIAVTKASEASTSASNALASENKAKKWADESVDVPVESGLYSAKHWAAKASSIVVAGLIDDVSPSTSTVFSSTRSNNTYEPKNSNIQSHINNTTNPHGVTKAQVGLSNVDNTSDVNKPVSTAIQNALDLKQNVLVSGTNIKTVNSSSILGSGNFELLTSINPVITGSITEQVYDLTGTAINPANGTIQYKTVSANTTFTETLTSGQSVLLRLIGADSKTITFPTITWVGAVAPTLTANCAIVLWKEQSTLYGSFVGTLV